MIEHNRYDGHFFSSGSDTPQAGWKLDDCQVEEYPFGSGNPDRVGNTPSVLRLIPGGGFNQHLENQEAGKHLRHWVTSVAQRYNEYQRQQTGRNPGITANGVVYCVDFDPSFTAYLPEDLVNENYCARAYGPEFTLVNDYLQGGQRTWDPWFDVPNTNRKSPVLMHYVDPNGDLVIQDPHDNDYAVYDVLPPTYCLHPSPGRHTFDAASNTWNLRAGYQSEGRLDDIVTNVRCTNPPGVNSKRENLNETAVEVVDATRTHPRDLPSKRATGGFLDPNVYIFMGCLDNDEGDGGEGVDPCDADNNPCGDSATNVPTTNGANPTQDPLPPSSEGGFSTGPVTAAPTGGGGGGSYPYTTTNPWGDVIACASSTVFGVAATSTATVCQGSSSTVSLASSPAQTPGFGLFQSFIYEYNCE
jgi:hypothetical protein